MIIAVDGMGGDNAPIDIVKGCIQASQLMEDEIHIVGDEKVLKNELMKYTYDKNKIKIVHASQVISNDDQPVKAVRTKTDSSLVVGINLVKEGKADVFASAGNTGALMTGGLFILGRIPGIDRPAIASVYPNPIHKKACLLVDAGANAECKANNLLEFGIMGNVYCEKVLNIKNPRVGLVNIGTETNKGTTVIKSAYEMLKKARLNFIGNIEARELQNSVADVIICDGFVGNVILKLTEGVALTLYQLVKTKIMEGTIAKVGALLLAGRLKELKKELDYSEYGGAPILGVKGAIIKMHGSSDANGIKNSILKARPYVENKVVKMIHDEVISLEEIIE